MVLAILFVFVDDDDELFEQSPNVVEGLNGRSIIALTDGTFYDIRVDLEHSVVEVILESILIVLDRGGWITFEVAHVVVCQLLEVIEVWNGLEQLVDYCHGDGVHHLLGISDAIPQCVDRQVLKVTVDIIQQCLLNFMESQELLDWSFDSKSHPREFFQFFWILADRSHLGDDEHYLLGKFVQALFDGCLFSMLTFKDILQLEGGLNHWQQGHWSWFWEVQVQFEFWGLVDVIICCEEGVNWAQKGCVIDGYWLKLGSVFSAGSHG